MEEDIINYFCRFCNGEVKKEDTICPKCGSDLEKVGKRREIEVTLEEKIGLSESVEIKLTKQEKRFFEWFKSKKAEWSKFFLDEIDIGFPSGITLRFKKKS